MKRLLQLGFLVVLAAGLTRAYEDYIGYVRTYLEHRFYPPLRTDPSAGLGQSIHQEATQRRFNEVLSEHRRLSALVEAARASGQDVGELEQKLAYALQLARQGRFGDAKIFLNIVEIKLPRPSETVRPAATQDAADPFPDLEKKPAPTARPKPRRRHSSRILE